MKAKHENLLAERMFYVFVDVGRDEDSSVSFFVMPSQVVAQACKVSHEIWLQTPGVRGRPHGDSEMRRLLPKYARNDRMKLSKLQNAFMDSHDDGWMEQYRNAWHLISKKL